MSEIHVGEGESSENCLWYFVSLVPWLLVIIVTMSLCVMLSIFRTWTPVCLPHHGCGSERATQSSAWHRGVTQQVWTEWRKEWVNVRMFQLIRRLFGLHKGSHFVCDDINRIVTSCSYVKGIFTITYICTWIPFQPGIYSWLSTHLMSNGSETKENEWLT